MQNVSTHHDALASLLGPDLIFDREGVICAMPRSAAEAAEVLRYADERQIPVRIEGAGTKSGWCEVTRSEIVLLTTGLQGVREHVWQDLTVTVGAGTVWSHLQQVLAAHGQTVALDPLWPDTATVGGIIATNDSGALRTRYGSLRDLIIGMTIVLADGTVAKTGGKVVKNVAGYDLHKLMTGAFGSLGLITEVTFRLHPIPKSHATWTVSSEEIVALDRVRHTLADSTLPLEALQLRTSDRGFALDVKLAFLTERLPSVGRQLGSLVAPLGAEEGSDDVWPMREGLFSAVQATVKVTSVAAGLAPLLTAVASGGGRAVAQQSGIVIAGVPADGTLVTALREKAEAAGGSLTILSWPKSVAGRPGVWGKAGDALPLMREIKRRFDPSGILNAGCFLDGL